jgi:quercetin dioxygenase-like cupin family protein
MNMMFHKRSEDGYYSRIKGIDQKTLVYGAKTLLAEFRLVKGAVVPNHSHPHEQTGYLISGHMVFLVGGRRYEALPGDSWCIPVDVEHGAEVIEDTVVVEVFSPAREDYLPDKKY